MIFVDSNVPMYLVGAPHPNKDRTVELLELLAEQGERFVTDAEVYQELLHRYAAIRRFNVIDAAFEALDRVVDEVLTFGMSEVRAAKALMGTIRAIFARDALHVAVMQTAGVERIMSFDRGFDACPGIERLE